MTTRAAHTWVFSCYISVNCSMMGPKFEKNKTKKKQLLAEIFWFLFMTTALCPLNRIVRTGLKYALDEILLQSVLEKWWFIFLE